MAMHMNVLPSTPKGSLKSSSFHGQKGVEPKSVDRALHEASERFVETMPDSRITFFSSSEHLERRVKKEKGYFLKGKGRVGYLLCMPKRPLLWMDEQKKQCIRVGARLSKSLFDENSVFIATFDKYDSCITIDDCWIYKGKSLIALPFTQRWEYVLKMYDHDYKRDEFLENGIQIQPAAYYAMTAFQTVARGQEWIHWMPEDASQKRMRIQLKQREASTIQEQISQKKLAHKQSPEKQIKQTAHLTAKAVPHEEFPDTYTLYTAEGTEKGIAAIQKFAISQSLKQLFEKEKKEYVYVRVGWNADFEKWQITGVAPSEECEASPESQWKP